jgi:hypothetical protein
VCLTCTSGVARASLGLWANNRISVFASECPMELRHVLQRSDGTVLRHRMIVGIELKLLRCCGFLRGNGGSQQKGREDQLPRLTTIRCMPGMHRITELTRQGAGNYFGLLPGFKN